MVSWGVHSPGHVYFFDIFLYQTFGNSVKIFQNGQSAQPHGLPLILCLDAFTVGVQVYQSYPIHLSWCPISWQSADVHWISKVYQALSHDIRTLYLLHFSSNVMFDGGWNLISLFGTKIKVCSLLSKQLTILVQDANDINWTQKNAWEKIGRTIRRWGQVCINITIELRMGSYIYLSS